ncbi:hypothetical protein BV25DRAFT_1893981 [Artomyces pyxidatus]|uniref:Uncharacterized protein n=1 Tax=Artomyces pyxidatus TaxID=48021 RepID=A0ACB8SJA0_9AGAM|nr:hypothetical protein BV25DRAFT_1893981 [Artomyces pyxidatus]
MGWDSRKEDVTVHIKHLWCTSEQHAALGTLYNTNTISRDTYALGESGQAAALRVLEQHGLDAKARDRLESRWTEVWNTKWTTKGGTMRRILVQCTCGYATSARQEFFEKQKKSRPPQPSSSNSQAWTRAAPYDFTGCLAHADITYNELSGAVSRVVGYLVHNDRCEAAKMTRVPRIPLHTHVVQVALQQLAEGASVSTIQARNLDMCSRKAYRDQAAVVTLEANVRYELLSADFRSLYRQYYRSQGIDITKAPERNIHNWLDPTSRHFKPAIHSAVFLYAPRTTATERFKLCICTKDMEDAAWSYVHDSQLMLDGTFGLSTSRILVWIAMGVDSGGKGVPVAIFLFSAPTGNRATHAGYDTRIITELLNSWKTWMSSRPSAAGRAFEPAVAITDTDIKERGALLAVWPRIILLLCKFHVRQCWTNKRSSLIGRGGSADTSFWKVHVLARVRTLENALLQSSRHEDATALLQMEREGFKVLLTSDDSRVPCKAGLAYLDYFEKTWMPPALWSSWSQHGRNLGAARLGIDVAGVLPTTNHLESFNGVLKAKYLPQWQHSGHRLRFDVLSSHLILHICPRLFAQLRQSRQYADWKSSRFEAAAGGVPLLRARRPAIREWAPRAWFEADASRNVLGIDIHQHGRLCVIPSSRQFERWATCATSSADINDPLYPRYWLALHISGAATCTCPDWLRRGGACKHLRAFAVSVQLLVLEGVETQSYSFAKTEAEALEVEAQNRTWYGPHYATALTLALSPKDYPAGYSHHLPPPTMSAAVLEQASQAPPPPPPQILANSGPGASAEALCLLESLYSDPEEHQETPSSDLDESRLDTTFESEIPTTEGSARNELAISIQVQQRIAYELKQVLPRLHGLVTLFTDAASLEITSDILELREVLDSLTCVAALRCEETIGELPISPGKTRVQECGNSGLNPFLGNFAAPTTPPPAQQNKRVRDLSPALLGASPERRQKRVQSRSWL